MQPQADVEDSFDIIMGIFVENLFGSSPSTRLNISPQSEWPKVEVDGPIEVGM